MASIAETLAAKAKKAPCSLLGHKYKEPPVVDHREYPVGPLRRNGRTHKACLVFTLKQCERCLTFEYFIGEALKCPER